MLHCNLAAKMQRAFSALVATPARRTALAVAALTLLVLLPFAGNYGAWDPWETHYGEVARQMLARNDFISLWWPGSPLDHAPRGEFWSKPVLTFWLEALSLKLAGIQWSGARADELVTSWRAEWALRMPSLLLAMASIAAVFDDAAPARLAPRRRHRRRHPRLVARVDPDRAPGDDRHAVRRADDHRALPRRAGAARSAARRRSRRCRAASWRALSWPHAPAFYGFAALFIATTATQLLIDSIQLRWRVSPTLDPARPRADAAVHRRASSARFGGRPTRRPAASSTSSARGSCARWRRWPRAPPASRCPRSRSSLYLVCAGRWRDIFRLELVRGGLVFVACGIPWWHAMLIRHGRPFWNELIGDNYVNRAAGRNGDRGTFEYYLQWVAYGMFPWSGIAAVGSVASFLAPKSPRGALARFALVWLAVDVATITLVNTKFHHYSLPALPAIAILAALFLDDVLTAPKRWHAVALGLIAVPLTFACGRDLAAYPPRFLWMFDYDYVLVPGTGRPWPSTTIYGNRYEYGSLLWVLGLFATAAVAAFTVVVARRYATQTASADVDDAAAPSPPPLGRVYALAGAFVMALVIAIAAGPSTPNGAAPSLSPWLWLVPAMPMLVALVYVGRSVRLGALIPLAAVAVVYGAFLLDRYLPDLGPHWSQKHVIAAVLRASHRPRRAAHRLQPLLARRELLHAQRDLLAVGARRKMGVGRAATSVAGAVVPAAQGLAHLHPPRAPSPRAGARHPADRLAPGRQDRRRQQQQAIAGGSQDLAAARRRTKMRPCAPPS